MAIKRRVDVLMIALSCAISAVFSQAHAQADSAARPSAEADTVRTSVVTRGAGSDWLVGGTLMSPASYGGTGLLFTMVGVQTSSFRLNRPGVDLAFVAAPQGLLVGALFGGVRANISLPIRLDPAVYVVPSAGLSLAGGAGAGGNSGGGRGVNGTLAFIFAEPPRSDSGSSFGVRLAFARHRFSNESSAVTLVEVGFVRWKR